MKIEFEVNLPTTMSKAENCCDEDSADNFADCINNEIEGNVAPIKTILSTKDFGKLEFIISLKNNCIDSYSFNCVIKVKSEVDIEMDNYAMYTSLSNDIDLLNRLSTEISNFVKDVNNIVKSFKHPYKETFKFISDEYYIKINPFSIHTPEFTSLAIETDVDIDEIIDNLDVY